MSHKGHSGHRAEGSRSRRRAVSSRCPCGAGPARSFVCGGRGQPRPCLGISPRPARELDPSWGGQLQALGRALPAHWWPVPCPPPLADPTPRRCSALDSRAAKPRCPGIGGATREYFLEKIQSSEAGSSLGLPGPMPAPSSTDTRYTPVTCSTCRALLGTYLHVKNDSYFRIKSVIVAATLPLPEPSHWPPTRQRADKPDGGRPGRDKERDRPEGRGRVWGTGWTARQTPQRRCSPGAGPCLLRQERRSRGSLTKGDPQVLGRLTLGIRDRIWKVLAAASSLSRFGKT